MLLRNEGGCSLFYAEMLGFHSYIVRSLHLKDTKTGYILFLILLNVLLVLTIVKYQCHENDDSKKEDTILEGNLNNKTVVQEHLAFKKCKQVEQIESAKLLKTFQLEHDKKSSDEEKMKREKRKTYAKLENLVTENVSKIEGTFNKNIYVKRNSLPDEKHGNSSESAGFKKDNFSVIQRDMIEAHSLSKNKTKTLNSFTENPSVDKAIPQNNDRVSKSIVKRKRSSVVNIGDVGYKFQKRIPGHGFFNGVVKEIRCGAEDGKDRRCVYSDGNFEDFTLDELISLHSDNIKRLKRNTKEENTYLKALPFHNNYNVDIITNSPETTVSEQVEQESVVNFVVTNEVNRQVFCESGLSNNKPRRKRKMINTAEEEIFGKGSNVAKAVKQKLNENSEKSKDRKLRPTKKINYAENKIIIGRYGVVNEVKPEMGGNCGLSKSDISGKARKKSNHAEEALMNDERFGILEIKKYPVTPGALIDDMDFKAKIKNEDQLNKNNKKDEVLQSSAAILVDKKMNTDGIQESNVTDDDVLPSKITEGINSGTNRFAILFILFRSEYPCGYFSGKELQQLATNFIQLFQTFNPFSRFLKSKFEKYTFEDLATDIVQRLKYGIRVKEEKLFQGNKKLTLPPTTLENDVLFCPSRPEKLEYFVANNLFRNLIDERIEAEEIVQHIHSLNPSGRFFLVKDGLSLKKISDRQAIHVTNKFLQNEATFIDNVQAFKIHSENPSENKNFINMFFNVNDVGCGAPGTDKYNEIIAGSARNAKNTTFTSVAKEVMSRFRAMKPPSRFFKKIGENYIELNESQVREKIIRDISRSYKKNKKTWK